MANKIGPLKTLWILYKPSWKDILNSGIFCVYGFAYVTHNLMLDLACVAAFMLVNYKNIDDLFKPMTFKDDRPIKGIWRPPHIDDREINQ